MLRSAHGEDVVVDQALFAVPLDGETFLAALGVPGKSTVAEPKPLYLARLLDDVRDAGCVQRPETVVPGEYTDGRTDLYRRAGRQ
jgi:hypothetical protein